MIDLVKKSLFSKLGDVVIEDLKILPMEGSIGIECKISKKGKITILKTSISQAEILKAVEDAMFEVLKEKLVVEHE